MATSDLSGYYSLSVQQLNGTTIISSLDWGSASPDIYRQAVVPNPGTVGQLPLSAFTRSTNEAGNTATTIADTGAVIIARFAQATAAARIGIVPRLASNVISQLQPLTPDPFAKVFALPGDSVYLLDGEFNPAGGPGRIDFYVRPINFPELDAMITLPQAPSLVASANPVFAVDVQIGTLTWTRAPRVIYLVTPPSANYEYTPVAPEMVPVGWEQVFIGTNNTPFVLVANEINGGADITNRLYVPGRGALTLVSGGGFYAPIGSGSNRALAIASGQPIPVFRGLQKISFNLGASEAFALPDLSIIPNDAVLYAQNASAGAPVITLTGTVNGGANMTLSSGQGAVLVPYGTVWIGVKT